MELDFTRLFTLQAPEQTGRPENAPKYLNVDREKQRQAEAFKIHKQRAEMLLKSEQIRQDINKAINNMEDEHSILLKALECIYLMTGDVEYMLHIGKLKRAESERMPGESLIWTYSNYLKAYNNYIKALEEKDETKKGTMYKLLNCKGDEQALERVNFLSYQLSDINAQIKATGHPGMF